jgi:putative thiamine transport system ATP-binding protein
MLHIKNLTIANGENLLFSGLSVDIAPGEVVTLTGISGSGKSTLLNWIIGDLDPIFLASGELWLGDVRCEALPIEARHIGLLFQDDLLFPHLSVGHNLAFALPERVQGSAARRKHVEQTLEDIGLPGFHDRDPASLSGGQRSRVSVMRTLLAEPAALLLDEPFSKLDTALRTQFREFVFAQIARQGIPTLLVTHDAADVPPGGRVIEISDWQHSHA